MILIVLFLTIALTYAQSPCSKNADTYFNQGNAYLDKGLNDQTTNGYTRVIEINPKYAKAYKSRGGLYFAKSENRARSCADMKMACELGVCGNYKTLKQNGACS